MIKSLDKKMYYFFVGCITLSVIIIGATYAYFTANVSDDKTVNGATETTSFSMSVERVTTVDMAYGLIPMKNVQAPNAARQLCKDDNNNAGCQIYKITLKGDSDQVMFVDGYVSTNPKEGVETRISRVFPEEVEVTDDETMEVFTKTIFNTDYSKDDFDREDFVLDEVIKTGVRGSDVTVSYNQKDDYDCLVVKNEKIGGDVGKELDIYIMVWLYDNGENQNYMQGLELVYTGEVSFVTAYGNEIKATFD